MKTISINKKGVLKLLHGLKEHKASGADDIHPRILKAAATELAPVLTQLFQLSLDTGQTPKDWRDARVVPIFKKGEKHQPANYRPVSLTSIICKILEHIVHSSIMDHLDQHRILQSTWIQEEKVLRDTAPRHHPRNSQQDGQGQPGRCHPSRLCQGF
ncbi:hypothetical protein SNE40_009833 [Patella caerulea]|uniref:Uncharacterized protein n=1 Tax=Patella caerulea TaxID=87958 RepID=A0AAN8PSX3_PATCE